MNTPQISTADTSDFFASSISSDDIQNNSKTYVTFDIASQSLAADVAVVREILDMQSVAELPNARSDILGMIDVRGEGIAVIDLQERLGLRGDSSSQTRKIIVLEIGDEQDKKTVGIIADRVRNVLEIGDDRIEKTPSVPGNWDPVAMDGVARLDGRLVYVLSFARLLGEERAGPFDFD